MNQNVNDLDENNSISLKLRLFNFYYLILRKKSVNLIILIIFIIIETIELISYAFNQCFEGIWKMNKKSFELIQLITGASRIAPLMKFLSFNGYAIIFCIISVLIFFNSLFMAMALLFGNAKPKLYDFCINIQGYINSNLCFFFTIPIIEILLSMNKCENNKLFLMKNEDITCFKGTHFVYVVISIIITILQMIMVSLNSFLNFNPFNATDDTAIIDSSNNSLLAIFKLVLILIYVLVDNEWIQIVVMLLGSFICFSAALKSPTYNSNILQCLVIIENCVVFYTYLIVMLGQLMVSISFNGLIFFLPVGYILLSFISCFLFKYSSKNFVEAKTDFKNEDEFINRINFFKILVNDFIKVNQNRSKNNYYNNYKRKEIIIRGQVALHEENCLDEECPLKKFLENQGNFAVQRTALLQYANILYVNAIKQFPDSQAILLNFLKFNYEKKYNLSTAKIYLEKIERFKNSIREDYIIFFIKKSQSTIINEEGEEVVINEEDTPQHKLKKFRLLIDTSTKLYGEFWGNLATNLSHNLNLNKLFRLGNRINKYLKEMYKLWEELKNKKIDNEQINVLSLYSNFVKSILQNRHLSMTIENKIKDSNSYEEIKENTEKIDINTLTKILERPVYQIYSRSNDMGKCHIIQCSNSIIYLLGYSKQELIGKRIEMLMPFICQIEHANMLSERLKKLRQLMLENNNENLKDKAKNPFVILPKTKAGYLYPVNSFFDIYNDEDFANTFIIKVTLNLKDGKTNYPYYICTRPDYNIDSISSSALNLGFTLEMLKKYVINMKNLIIDLNGNILEFKDILNDYIEPKEVYFLGVDRYSTKNNKTIKKNLSFEKYDEKELNSLSKTKMLLNIIEIKFRKNEPLGYCFVLNEDKNIIKEEKIEDKINLIDHNQLIQYDRKLLTYDIYKFNYVRSNIVEFEEINEEDLSNSDEKSIKDGGSRKNINNSKDNSLKKGDLSSQRKSTERKKGKTTSSSSSSSSSDSENDEEGKPKKNPLTKEAILGLKYKDSDEVKNFILGLPFYGNDVNLTRKSPNGSNFRVGLGIEPNIKVTMMKHIKKIDSIYALDKKAIREKKKMMFNKRGSTNDSVQNNSVSQTSEKENVENIENDQKSEKSKSENDIKTKAVDNFDASVSLNFDQHLKNLFTKKSLLLLKISSIFYFVIIIAMITIEFLITYNRFRTLRNYVKFTRSSYGLLASFMYVKYFLTEALLAQNSSYTIYDKKYNDSNKLYISDMIKELSVYRENISNEISEFSDTDLLGKNCTDYIQNNKIYIMTLINNQPGNETLPFWTGINRIPTSIFYISRVESDVSNIQMSDRNVYELMTNLLNDYYIKWKGLTSIITYYIKNNCNITAVYIVIFVLSFVISLSSILLLYQGLAKFLEDGTRPVDLILTIKKSKLEELKMICENFMNKLMNKFLGEEVDKVDEEAGHIKKNANAGNDDIENNIVITKFKKHNRYNQTVLSNNNYFKIYLISIVIIVIFEIYFIIKFSYSSTSLKEISFSVEVNNVTKNAEVDIILSYNVIKSFYYNNKIPLLNSEITAPILAERIKNITDAVEDWSKYTFLYMHSIGESYMDIFIELFFNDITYINTGNFNETDFLGSMKYGFISMVSRYLSLLKTATLMDVDNVSYLNISDNEEVAENGLKIVYVIRPWFNIINQALENAFDKIFDKMILLCLFLFISFLAAGIVIYMLVWKNIEFQLEKYYTNSVELILLIPDLIKEVLIKKIGEEEDMRQE